jgi:hypothetical protein
MAIKKLENELQAPKKSWKIHKLKAIKRVMN